MNRIKNFLHDRMLGIVLFWMFLLSWIGQYLTHDKSFTDFLNATFENWQSEFLQVLVFVVISAFFIYKGSPQSKDGDDEMKKRLNQIEENLKQMREGLNRLEALILNKQE